MNYFPGLVMSSYLPLHHLSERRPLVGVKKWENRRVRPQRLVFAHFKMYEKTDTTLVSVQYICGYNQVVSFTIREEKDLLCVVCLEIMPQLSIFKQSHLWNFFTEDVCQDLSPHTRALVTHKTAEQPVGKNIHKNIYRWEQNIFLPRIKRVKTKIWNIQL